VPQQHHLAPAAARLPVLLQPAETATPHPTSHPSLTLPHFCWARMGWPGSSGTISHCGDAGPSICNSSAAACNSETLPGVGVGGAVGAVGESCLHSLKGCDICWGAVLACCCCVWGGWCVCCVCCCSLLREILLCMGTSRPPPPTQPVVQPPHGMTHPTQLASQPCGTALQLPDSGVPRRVGHPLGSKVDAADGVGHPLGGKVDTPAKRW
jgi:hypothetical protein